MEVEPAGLFPQLRTPRSIAWVRGWPSGVVQCCPGWITTWARVAGSSAKTYGSGPRMTATLPAPSRTGASPSGITQACPLTTDTSDRGARSSIRTDHGGSMITRSANAPRARGPSRRPPKTSTATKCRRTRMNLRLLTMASLIDRELTDPYDSHEDTDNLGARRDRQDRPTGGAATNRPRPSRAGRLTIWPAAL